MISVTILTKNSAETLSATLDSLRAFSEILLFDTGSTDSTLQIAKKYPNVKIAQHPFTGFGDAHNKASQLASHDWILSIDSDEILSPALSEEILQLPLNPSRVYSLDRRNHFHNKKIPCWNPDPVIRLYHRQSTRFSSHAVHEKVLSDNLSIVPLQGPLLHTPYRSIEDFLSKLQHYSTLFADQNQGKKQASLWSALGHGFAALLKSYFLKRGFLGGKEGLIISIYNAHTAYYKYLKLSFRNETLPSQKGNNASP